MNLGTMAVSLLLIAIVALIIRSIVKDSRAGKNVGCGSCKSCAHTTSSQKTSHATAGTSCPSCANVDKMLTDMQRASNTASTLSSNDSPSELSH